MALADKLKEVISIQADIARLGRDLGGVMNLVAQRTPGLVGADGAVVELAEGEDMVYRAAAGTAARSLGTRLRREGSLSGACMAQGVVLRCDDSETDPRVNREACRQVGLRSMLVLPLMHGGECVGVLKALSSQPAAFDDDQAALLGLLGDAVGSAMYFATHNAESDLFHLATHDPLTQLPNRALFADRLAAAVAGAQRYGLAVGVVMVDLDDFKPINDQFGHAAGDAVLVEFGRRLAGCARESDTVARIGGDEFAVVLSPLHGGDGLQDAVARQQAALAAPFAYRGRDIVLRASMGGAVAPAEADDAHDLLELADQRMYEAKRAGKQAVR